jgi:hypothetical protein
MPAPLPPRDQPPAAWVPRPEDYLRPTGRPPVALGAPGQLHAIAGVLLATSGIVAMAWTVAVIVRFPSPSDVENITANATPIEWATAQICFLLGIWGQAIALLAGVMAYYRLHWRFTVACSMLSTLAIGSTAAAFLDTYFGGAALLGIIGIALLSRGRREFAS